LITAGPEGGLWLHTGNGIARFDPSIDLDKYGKRDRDQAWTIYTEDDGLVGYYDAIAFGPDNEVWFGTNRFQPVQAGSTRPSVAPTQGAALP
jgi:hypothetical protein